MAILRSLLVNLSMNSAQYRADLEKSKKKTNTDLKAMSASAATFAVKSAAAFATTATAMAVMNAKAVREMNNFAKMANTTAAEMRTLEVAGASVGLTAEKMADQFKDVQEKLGEFTAEGTGTFLDFFNTMQMTTEEAEKFAAAVDGMSGENIVRAMVAEMEKTGKTANEMSYALEGVGSDLTQMLPLLLDNGKELDAMRDRVKGVANALTAEDIAQYTKLAGEVDVLDLSVTMFSNKLIAQVLPTMNELAKKTSDWIQDLTTGIDEGNLGAAKGALAHLGYELDDLRDKAHEAAVAQQMLADGNYTSAYQVTALTEAANKAGFYAEEIERVQAEMIEATKEVEKFQAIVDKPVEITIDLKPPLKKKSFGEMFGGQDNVDPYALRVYTENQKIADAMAERLIISQVTMDEQYEQELKFMQDNLADYDTYLAAKAGLDAKYAEQKKAAEIASMQAIASATSAFSEALMNTMDEESKAYKAMFLLNQASAFANAIVNAELASSAILAREAPIMGMSAVGAAAMVKGLGYASAGVIAGQAIGSIFHGGTDMVPDAATRKDSSILIEGGERIISKNHNKELMGIMRGLNGGASGNVTVQVMGNIYGDSETQRIIQSAAQQGYAMVGQDFSTNGVLYKKAKK